MNDKCPQYGEEYEKLLELKQEFDKALKAPAFAISATERQGRKQEDWAEVKGLKDEMMSIMNRIEGNIFEGKSLRQLREIALFWQKNRIETPEELLKRCRIDKESKTVIVEESLLLSSFGGEIPDNLEIQGIAQCYNINVKNINSNISAFDIDLSRNETEEISGNLEAVRGIYCQNAENLRIISGNLISPDRINLQKSLALERITGRISCGDLYLNQTGLKALPENMQVHNIYLNKDNKELYESALQRKREGKISGKIFTK